MSRTITLIVLALVAAAVAAPIATAGMAAPAASCSQAENPSGCYQGKPFVDPLGVSYQRLFAQTQTESRVTSPTRFVDPLAISYLAGMGLTPAQIKDWTVGVCAQGAKKPAVCFAPFHQTSASRPTVASSSGFRWGDATIGAAATLGTVLLLGGLGAILVMSRHGRRRTIASA